MEKCWKKWCRNPARNTRKNYYRNHERNFGRNPEKAEAHLGKIAGGSTREMLGRILKTFQRNPGRNPAIKSMKNSRKLSVQTSVEIIRKSRGKTVGKSYRKIVEGNPPWVFHQRFLAKSFQRILLELVLISLGFPSGITSGTSLGFYQRFPGLFEYFFWKSIRCF